MMRRARKDRQRKGGVTAIVVLLLIPLLTLLAFAVDLNYQWATQAELQSAADGAANAAATELIVVNVPGVNLSTAVAAAVSTAQHYGAMHSAGGAAVVINSSDVVAGAIADPTVASSQLNGQFQAYPAATQPNSVQVTVRRDSNVTTGPLALLFGPVFGVPNVSISATGTATLRGGPQQVIGFSGKGNRLLPLAMSQATYNALFGTGSAPPEVTLQDSFIVKPPLTSGRVPPANVSSGSDGVQEAVVNPNTSTTGNFSWLSLLHTGGGTTTQLRTWMANGASTSDLSGWGHNGLQASSASPLQMFGISGHHTTTMHTALHNAIGQPRVIPVYSAFDPTDRGYTVVGFVGVTIVAAATNGVITVQLSPVIDPSATLAPAGVTGPPTLIYQGVSLSR